MVGAHQSGHYSVLRVRSTARRRGVQGPEAGAGHTLGTGLLLAPGPGLAAWSCPRNGNLQERGVVSSESMAIPSTQQGKLGKLSHSSSQEWGVGKAWSHKGPTGFSEQPHPKLVWAPLPFSISVKAPLCPDTSLTHSSPKSPSFLCPSYFMPQEHSAPTLPGLIPTQHSSLCYDITSSGRSPGSPGGVRETAWILPLYACLPVCPFRSRF